MAMNGGDASGIQVIGAGFGRTGTNSLRLALNMLGFKTFHMFELLESGNKTMAAAALRGEEEDVSVWFRSLVDRGYNATTDFPTSLLYKQQLKLFPQAKVVLTVRNYENWFESWNNLQNTYSFLIDGFPFAFFVSELDAMFTNTIRSKESKFNMAPCKPLYAKSSYFQPWYLPWIRLPLHYYIDKAECIQWHKDFVEEVKQTVPQEQLLVFDVRQGWKPLLDFLDLPLPEGQQLETFIPSNDSGNMRRMRLVLLFLGVVYPLLPLLIIVALWKVFGKKKRRRKVE